jgi:hypothetical protein
MKKIIFVCIGLLIASHSMGQRISLGPKAGVNFSTISNADGVSSLTGLTAGGFFVYSIIEHFGVSLDVLYSGEGAKYSETINTGGIVEKTEFTTRLNYLRVPLLANVFFGSLGDRLRPKISFGPSFGFLLGVKNEMTVTTIENGETTIASTKSTDKDGFSSFDLGAIIGAGLNYKLNDNTWLNLDGRYNIGATGIYDVEDSEEDPSKNNVASVTLGLAFAFGE